MNEIHEKRRHGIGWLLGGLAACVALSLGVYLWRVGSREVEPASTEVTTAEKARAEAERANLNVPESAIAVRH